MNPPLVRGSRGRRYTRDSDIRVSLRVSVYTLVRPVRQLLITCLPGTEVEVYICAGCLSSDPRNAGGNSGRLPVCVYALARSPVAITRGTCGGHSSVVLECECGIETGLGELDAEGLPHPPTLGWPSTPYVIVCDTG